MVDSPPGTLWEDPVAEIALCHGIGCCVGGVLTEEVLGIRFGLPLKITPHNGGSLRVVQGLHHHAPGPGRSRLGLPERIATNCGRRFPRA